MCASWSQAYKAGLTSPRHAHQCTWALYSQAWGWLIQGNFYPKSMGKSYERLPALSHWAWGEKLFLGSGQGHPVAQPQICIKEPGYAQTANQLITVWEDQAWCVSEASQIYSGLFYLKKHTSGLSHDKSIFFSPARGTQKCWEKSLSCSI